MLAGFICESEKLSFNRDKIDKLIVTSQSEVNICLSKLRG